MQYIELINGVKLPQLGYGTFQIPLLDTRKCVLEALQLGYRLIDSATVYGNETEIGLAIKDSMIERSEITLTTKVWIQDCGYEKTLQAFERSLSALDVAYIDIYLIHHPFGDYYGAWRAMEELYRQGKIKVIGVCNFSAERFVDLCLNVEIPPMINQLECHPFFQRNELFEVLNSYGCHIEAWGPLAEGQCQIFQNECFNQIANKHHKSIAQVILRWHIQNGVIAIPKTVQGCHMKENLEIWDFELDEKDLMMIHTLDLGYSEIINHQSYTTAKWLNMHKIHEE